MNATNLGLSDIEQTRRLAKCYPILSFHGGKILGSLVGGSHISVLEKGITRKICLWFPAEQGFR